MTVCDITVEEESWESICPDYEAIINHAIALVFGHAPVAHELTAFGAEAEISVVLSNDNAVRDLNRDYRGKDKPTNILSFAMLDEEDGWTFPSHPGPCALGDLVIALETVQREAQAESKPFPDHLIHLVIHGMLHLLGYDHIDDGDADEMESLEIQMLSKIGIKNPYKIQEIDA